MTSITWAQPDQTTSTVMGWLIAVGMMTSLIIVIIGRANSHYYLFSQSRHPIHITDVGLIVFAVSALSLIPFTIMTTNARHLEESQFEQAIQMHLPDGYTLYPNSASLNTSSLLLTKANETSNMISCKMTDVRSVPNSALRIGNVSCSNGIQLKP